ncbi:hypothetical protein AAIH00_36440, partial [Pseudomonas aeruginosa]
TGGGQQRLVFGPGQHRVFRPSLGRGAVILEMNYEAEKFNGWMARFEDDIQSVERFVNHTHIYDIFSGCSEDVEDEIFEQLAHMLSLSWRLILKEKFPDRDF